MNKGNLVKIVLLIAIMLQSQIEIRGSSMLIDTNSNTLESESITITVEREGDWSTHITSAGDVNADGIDDIIVGVRYDDEGGSSAGQAYLIFGKNKWQGFDLSQADASFIGEMSNDWLGSTASGVGDINQDGFDDFILAALLNSEAGTNAGQSYLFMGKSTSWNSDTPVENADASFQGENNYDLAHGVYHLGDVNGDGFDDFLLPGYKNSEAGSYAGQVYLFLGSSNLPWTMDTSLGSANASYLGRENTILGIDAAGIGDINGDGYNDFAMGSQGNVCWCSDTVSKDGPRIVDIVFGKSKGWNMDNPIADANITITSEKDNPIVYDASFSWISGVGDVNNDGLDDFVVGSYTDDTIAKDSGSVHLFFGKKNWNRDYALNESDVSFYGKIENTWAGFSVAGVNDVNGDNYDDFLIGAPHSFGIEWCCSRITRNPDFAGEAYLILGRDDWTASSILEDNFIAIKGYNESAFGYHLEGLGDINADGLADFGISTIGIGDLTSSNPKGAVRIYFGSNTLNSQSTLSDRSDADTALTSKSSKSTFLWIVPWLLILYPLWKSQKKQ